VRRAFDALSAGDSDAFLALLERSIEIQTAKGIRRGLSDALVWAESRYEHLDRRYTIDDLRERGDAVLALAHVEYVWRESGELGDRSPVAILFLLRQGKITRIHIYETWDEAIEAFGD
jgi:ketosteroid isomerase-like protein